VHSYAYLLRRVGIDIKFIIWNYLRTTRVPSPTLNKDGSISKRKINTDRRTYERFLKENKIHPKGDEVIGVENKLESLPETLSLLRVRNSVNLKVGEMFVREWLERARRAQAITRPLRTFNRNCSWDCDYYELCQIDMLGRDRETHIKQNFVQISKRNGEETK